MKLGFLGGAFNPPTIAHYNLIKKALKEYEFDKVFFVPVNDFYPKKNLVQLEHRINMLEVMCKHDKDIIVYKTENTKPLRTIDIFKILENEYPKDEIVFFMGEDNYYKMPTWANYEELKKYNYIIFQRNEKFDANINKPNVIYMKNDENLSVSSTIIRNRLLNNQSVSDLIDKDVENYIMNKKLYIKDFG